MIKGGYQKSIPANTFSITVGRYIFCLSGFLLFMTGVSVKVFHWNGDISLLNENSCIRILCKQQVSSFWFSVCSYKKKVCLLLPSRVFHTILRQLTLFLYEFTLALTFGNFYLPVVAHGSGSLGRVWPDKGLTVIFFKVVLWDLVKFDMGENQE